MASVEGVEGYVDISVGCVAQLPVGQENKPILHSLQSHFQIEEMAC